MTWHYFFLINKTNNMVIELNINIVPNIVPEETTSINGRILYKARNPITTQKNKYSMAKIFTNIIHLKIIIYIKPLTILYNLSLPIYINLKES